MKANKAVTIVDGTIALATDSPITSVPSRRQLFGKSELFKILLWSVSVKSSTRKYRRVSSVQLARMIWTFEYAKITKTKIDESTSLISFITRSLSYKAYETLTFLTGVKAIYKSKSDKIKSCHLCKTSWCRRAKIIYTNTYMITSIY